MTATLSEAKSALHEYLASEAPSHCPVTVDKFQMTTSQVFECLTADQAQCVAAALQFEFDSWERGRFKLFGLNKNQSRKGTQHIIDLLGLAKFICPRCDPCDQKGRLCN